jgi:hypothetical protein
VNKINYCNSDSILTKETDIDLMKQFILDNYGDLKIFGRYNNGIIISQGKYILFGDDKNKIRNIGLRELILEDLLVNKYKHEVLSQNIIVDFILSLL